MAKTISSLNVRLGSNIKGLTSGLAAAASSVKGFASRITSSVGSTMARVGKLASIGGLLGGALGGLGAGMLAKSSLADIDAIGKLADRLGMTTAALAGLRYAGQLAGVGTEEITNAINRMLVNVGKAADDTTELTTMLLQYGVSAKDLAAMDTESQFKALAGVIASIKSPADRARLATEAFGRSGANLLPLLQQGAAGIEAAQREAERLGITFNRLDASRVEAANDAMTKLGASIRGVFNRIVIAIAPTIQSIADGLTSAGASIGSWLGSWIPTIISRITAATQQVYAAITSIVAPIVSWIQERWSTIVATTSESLVAIGSLISAVWSAISSAVGAALDFITAALANLGVSSSSIGQRFIWLRDQVVYAMQVATYAVKNWRDVAEWVGVSVVHSVVKTVNQIGYFFGTVIPHVISWLADNWRNILVDMANLAWTTFKNISKNIYEFVVNLPGLIAGTTSLSDIWTPLGEGFRSTMTEMAALPERQIGELERAMGDEAARLGRAVSEGIADEIKRQQTLAEGLAGSIGSALLPAEIDKSLSKADIPVRATPVLDDEEKLVDKSGKEITKLNKDKITLELGTAVAAGSAMAQALRDVANPQIPTVSVRGADAKENEKMIGLNEKQVGLLSKIVDYLKQKEPQLVEI